MTTVRVIAVIKKKDEKCSAFRNVFDIMIEELDRANELITES